MKAKSSRTSKKSKVRNAVGSIKLSPAASGLTSQAGLIPVVKFLDCIGFEDAINADVFHQRGNNADYQFVGNIMLVVVGMIGGAPSYSQSHCYLSGWRFA